MPASRISTASRLIQGYYWLTPVFLFTSWRFGFDVRLPFLEAMPILRAAYYALLFGCGGLVFWRPQLTTLVGRAETTLSASTLILTTWGAYFTMIDEVATSGTLNNPFTPESVTSLALSASVLIVSLAAHDVPVHAPAAGSTSVT